MITKADLEYTSRLFCEAGKELFNEDFRGYHNLYLERRLNYFATRYGVDKGSRLIDMLINQPGIIHELKKELNIGYTAFYRDPSFFTRMTELIRRKAESQKTVHIWHAGCSKGHEVISLLILLEEAGLVSKCKIYATDINTKNLNQAEKGIIPIEDLQAGVKPYLAAGGNEHLGNYFNIAGQHAILRHKLIKKVKFGIHDLSKDAPFQKFDIILCRNVFIYYQPFFQKKLLSCIVASMKKESYLGLSPSENIEESGEALGLICFDRHLNIYKSGNSCKEESKNVKLPQL